MEEPNKFQKRKKDRPQDQGSRMIYLKAIQGILGKSMPKKKGEAATTQGKASLGDCPNQEGPSRKVEGPSKKVEGPARSRDGPSRSGEGRSRSREELVKSVEEGPAAKVTVTVSQKEESHTKVSVEKEASALDRSSFSDRRVIIDSVKKSSEELLGDRRTVIDKPSPALEFFDNSDSHADIQKVNEHTPDFFGLVFGF
jgi:TatD DNase family protein